MIVNRNIKPRNGIYFTYIDASDLINFSLTPKKNNNIVEINVNAY